MRVDRGKKVGRKLAFVDVERMLETGREIKRRLIERTTLACAASRKPLERGVCGARRLRIDEIEDGLRLGVVQPSVEKGALGEFAAPRKPGSRRKASREDTARRDRSAVALELDDILARVAVRRLEEENNGFIEKSFRFQA